MTSSDADEASAQDDDRAPPRRRARRDVLEIGRQTRPKLYDLRVTREPPLVPRELRFEVIERLDERGDGHGFGLAIARELAELHGGALILDEASGGGLSATVLLPRAARIE